MTEDLEKYLNTVNFEKQLKNLFKKLSNKKLIVYGCGQLFNVINEKYDLSKLNIIGVSDLKFTDKQVGEKYLGYKIVLKSRIKEENPDYVLISSKNYVDIIKNFDNNFKVKPLVRKPFFKELKEIWG